MGVKKELNEFFIDCFYSILNAEERSLESISNGKLSLKEIHVIEAVFKTMQKNENNFGNIAKLLGVTTGTLTIAFSKLEKKGYLLKERDQKDKRIFYIVPTRLAELINDEHTKFHEEMIEGIMSALNEKQQHDIIVSLKILGNFFKNK